MTKHDYFSFQERRCQPITLSLLFGKMGFVILGSNVNKGWFSINVGYTKFIGLVMKQYELQCFIHKDGKERK